jgi:hypothetical protein
MVRVHLLIARQHTIVVITELGRALTTDALRLRSALPEEYGHLMLGEPDVTAVHMHQPIL